MAKSTFLEIAEKMQHGISFILGHFCCGNLQVIMLGPMSHLPTAQMPPHPHCLAHCSGTTW